MSAATQDDWIGPPLIPGINVELLHGRWTETYVVECVELSHTIERVPVTAIGPMVVKMPLESQKVRCPACGEKLDFRP